MQFSISVVNLRSGGSDYTITKSVQNDIDRYCEFRWWRLKTRVQTQIPIIHNKSYNI
jgi:hypothetical protein